MQKAIISIIYHSIHGHTEQAAKLFAASLKPDGTKAHLFHINEIGENWQLLHNSDTNAFGSHTLFGNVSALLE